MEESSSTPIPARTISEMKGPIERNVTTDQYYEIDKVVEAIITKLNLTNQTVTKSVNIALQFPDHLLYDASEVCWKIEESLMEKSGLNDILVFLLGDTTHGACCVDEVAALHLSADLVVHYGRACLSPTQSVPVIYSFGLEPINVDHVIEGVLSERQGIVGQKLLLLYDVTFHHAVNEISQRFVQNGIEVAVGVVPDVETYSSRFDFPSSRLGNRDTGCCGEKQEKNCCSNGSDSVQVTPPFTSEDSSNNANTTGQYPLKRIKIIGGLEVRGLSDENSLSDYMLLYIGSNGNQLVNIMMRCSGTGGTAACWAYTPARNGRDGCLTTDAASVCRRELNRRFFLTQKARMAGVIGIVVGTLSNAYFRDVVSSIRNRIEEAGRASYTFAVGKINVNKLANFGEIDCFVLVACPENSLLDSRDFHVPIITPFELEVALGNREWDGFYSTEFSDYLHEVDLTKKNEDSNSVIENSDENNDNGKPYFSLVSGGYESSTKFKNKEQEKSKEGESSTTTENGQIIVYHSEAAEFLKRREYQGLLSKIGESRVTAAVKGQTGIASNYDNK